MPKRPPGFSLHYHSSINAEVDGFSLCPQLLSLAAAPFGRVAALTTLIRKTRMDRTKQKPRRAKKLGNNFLHRIPTECVFGVTALRSNCLREWAIIRPPKTHFKKPCWSKNPDLRRQAISMYAQATGRKHKKTAAEEAKAASWQGMQGLIGRGKSGIGRSEMEGL